MILEINIGCGLFWQTVANEVWLVLNTNICTCCLADFCKQNVANEHWLILRSLADFRKKSSDFILCTLMASQAQEINVYFKQTFS